MALVSVEDVVSRLDPQPDPSTHTRIELLIGDSERKIRTAFMKSGRDFDTSLAVVPWLQHEVEDVIREMVSAAIIIGPNAGVRTVASATGQESDTITYADVNSVSFGGVRLTDAQREALGVPVISGPMGWFPPVKSWPEVESR